MQGTNSNTQEHVQTTKNKGDELVAESLAAVDDFQRQAKEKTDAAAVEGQRDVEEMKASNVEYIEKTKQMANTAAATVQALLPTSTSGRPGDIESSPKAAGQENSSSTTSEGIISSVQGAANSLVETGKEYLESAQRVAQPQIEKMKGMVQGSAGKAGVPDGTLSPSPKMPGALPGTTAPLESGPHTVATMYPSEEPGSVKATDIAKTEQH